MFGPSLPQVVNNRIEFASQQVLLLSSSFFEDNVYIEGFEFYAKTPGLFYIDVSYFNLIFI